MHLNGGQLYSQTHFGFDCIFHNVICYVRSISTNEVTYVVVAFECGNKY